MKIPIIDSSYRDTMYLREYKNKVSKYKGVGYRANRPNPWIVRIVYRGKDTHIGSFNTEEIAALAYDYVSNALGLNLAFNGISHEELSSLSLTSGVLHKLNKKLKLLKNLVDN